MDREDAIWYFCGLTWGQWQDLEDAVRHTLKTMNGGRHVAMKELISKDCQATDLGLKLHMRGLNFFENGAGQPDSFARIVDTAKAARLANKLSPAAGFKLLSVDLKILRALGQNPGLSWPYLTSVYGVGSVKRLQGAGFIKQHSFDDRWEKWSWYTLDFTAIHLLSDLDGRA